MGVDTKQILRDPVSVTVDFFPSNGARHDQWAVIEVEDDVCDSLSITSSEEDSTTAASSSSSDLREDASSSTSYSSLASSSSPPPPPPQLSKGPLYELSELMAQLPIKRGLSKHYQGKSQSFTSLSSVSCLEDLAKRETPYRRKMKPCKSYGGGLDTHKAHSPKAIISKKASRGSFTSLLGKRNSFMGSYRPPIPVQRN